MAANHFDKKWFMAIRTDPLAQFNVVCFPWGGGAASGYMAWRELKSHCNIWALKLPGRESRIDDVLLTAAHSCIAEIMTALPDEADLPIIFYGHSMGAGLAMQTMNALLHQQKSYPVKLIASGRMPPHYPATNPVLGFGDKMLLSYLMKLNTNRQIFSDDKDFLDQYLPKMRADYALNGSIAPLTPANRPFSIAIINGHSDHLLEHDKLNEWQQHTQFPLHSYTLPGGHFFMQDNLTQFLDIIHREVLHAATLTA